VRVTAAVIVSIMRVIVFGSSVRPPMSSNIIYEDNKASAAMRPAMGGSDRMA
jgi:hypothetical protein